MAIYDTVVTITSFVQVEADNEEHAIAKIKASYPPRTIIDVVIPEEAKIAKPKKNAKVTNLPGQTDMFDVIDKQQGENND